MAIRDTPLLLPGGEVLHLSVSVGVAHAPVPHSAETLRELYAEADSALYSAKRAGRDRLGAARLASTHHCLPELFRGDRLQHVES
jgi:diguanylate cyclase (GGDEF)-like protein